MRFPRSDNSSALFAIHVFEPFALRTQLHASPQEAEKFELLALEAGPIATAAQSVKPKVESAPIRRQFSGDYYIGGRREQGFGHATGNTMEHAVKFVISDKNETFSCCVVGKGNQTSF